MTTAAVTGLMTLAVANPAQAAVTVQAQWPMTKVPQMEDTAGGDNNGTTSGVTMESGFYRFNGDNSVAQVPHNNNLNPGIKGIRVQAKINAATRPANGETYDILRKGTSSTAGGYYKIELKGTSTGMNAACIFKDQNRIVGRAIAPVSSGVWLNIVCAKTGTAVTLTVNGAVKKTTTVSVGAIANTAGVYVGGKGDGTDVFSGLMDSASIAIG